SVENKVVGATGGAQHQRNALRPRPQRLVRLLGGPIDGDGECDRDRQPRAEHDRHEGSMKQGAEGVSKDSRHARFPISLTSMTRSNSPSSDSSCVAAMSVALCPETVLRNRDIAIRL